MPVVHGAQPLRATILAVASFLAFGALLVLYGANASELIDTLELDYEQFGLEETFHTEGFFKRESSLFNQLRG